MLLQRNERASCSKHVLILEPLSHVDENSGFAHSERFLSKASASILEFVTRVMGLYILSLWSKWRLGMKGSHRRSDCRHIFVLLECPHFQDLLVESILRDARARHRRHTFVSFVIQQHATSWWCAFARAQYSQSCARMLRMAAAVRTMVLWFSPSDASYDFPPIGPPQR